MRSHSTIALAEMIDLTKYQLIVWIISLWFVPPGEMDNTLLLVRPELIGERGAILPVFILGLRCSLVVLPIARVQQHLWRF